jgi:hypothetical protein
MNLQATHTKYPDYFKFRAPEINLPFRKPTLILSYFDIHGEEHNLKKTASCKVCEKTINIVCGRSVNSSYTFALTFHLKKHRIQWINFLDNLAKQIVPDNMTKYEHFKRMEAPKSYSKEESNKRFDEFKLCNNILEENIAGVSYMFRDREFLQNSFHKYIEGHNAQMLEYLFQFSNRNLSLFDLMGTKHPNANLQENYKKSKCLIDNQKQIMIDFQRLLCENVCFHDPELYEHCPNTHTGDIAIFADRNYHNTFENFDDEIEKYTEFQFNKSFDHEHLKSVKTVENDRVAKVEMNRFLKIIITMFKIRRCHIREKSNQILSRSKAETGLIKPPLAINMWGPKYSDVTVPDELDHGKIYPEEMYSTFQHEKNEDCPAFKDKSKAVNDKPSMKDNKVKYPCNVGGCGKDCECDPCTDSGPLLCPNHHPDHPQMFDPEEDLSVSRRMFVDPRTKQSIYKRPLAHPSLHPPTLLLAGLKKRCKICRRNMKNHLRFHYTLHREVCDICNHMDFVSKNSFDLICYVCMKKFENKYRLEDHMNIHNQENPYFCKSCDKGYTTKYTYERHVLQNHEDNTESYVCGECNESYTLETNLKRHINEKHTPNENHYRCGICKTSFNRKDNMLQHQRIQHNFDVKKVTLPGINDEQLKDGCPFCDKNFKTKFTLNRHLETVHMQNSDVTFECKICKKVFRRKDKLQKHEKTHLEIKVEMSCEVCDRKFQSRDGLNAHNISCMANE